MVTYDVFIDAAHAAMPSSRRIDISVPANVNQFSVIAPGDGYMVAITDLSQSTDSWIGIVSNGVISQVITNSINHRLNVFVPVERNSTVLVNKLNVTITQFYFVYANGSLSDS